MKLLTGLTYAIYFIILSISINIKLIDSSKCNRTPEGHGALKTPADGRFHIRILENTNKYTPGKTYTIKLEGIAASSTPPTKHKFSGFMLVVERKSNESGLLDSSTSSFGVFTLSHGDTFTKITCANMVTHTTTTPKSEIQVLWTAPQATSGCVAFKATVIEHRDVWYMDDGHLTKEFCEEEQNFDESLNVPTQCCACAEAKYELTFEGLWSRNTHPKDFPSNNWVTKFSDIIGASHTIDYRFWQYGQIATDGLQQVAEFGTTKELETELKSQSGQIRTIIKAKGLSYPNVTGKTFAVFRVDQSHSLVSFVSMIDPSPDWFLGVSGLDLCLENCTWAESRTLDLYPWDAGTDSGPSYTSPDQPTNPRGHISRIRSDSTHDSRSPFYDASGASMKPLARLYLTRQRLYEKSCPDESDSDTDSKNPCALGPWKESSPCDAECGKGNKHQQRQYLNQYLADRAGCKHPLYQRIECYGIRPNCNDRSDETEEPDPSCALTDWTDWGECFPRCGHGTQTRTRKYVHKKAKKHCEGSTNHQLLKQTKTCYRSCSGDSADTSNPNDRDEGQATEDDTNEEPCEMSKWSKFGPCSKSCGSGVRIRTRTRLSGKCDEEEQEDTKQCNPEPCEIPDYCMEDPQSGDCDNSINMYFFNRNSTKCDAFTWSCSDHGNKFSTEEECMERCTGQTQSGINQQTEQQPNRRKINNRRIRN